MSGGCKKVEPPEEILQYIALAHVPFGNVFRNDLQYEGVRSEATTVRGQKIGVVTIKVFSKNTFEDVR